jgi:hypothetical protein
VAWLTKYFWAAGICIVPHTNENTNNTSAMLYIVSFISVLNTFVPVTFIQGDFDELFAFNLTSENSAKLVRKQTKVPKTKKARYVVFVPCQY